MRQRSVNESEKAAPCAPTKRRSTQAVKRPAAIPQAKKGRSGATSRFQLSRPRCHQRVTKSTAGKVAMTVLQRRPRAKASSASPYKNTERRTPNIEHRMAERAELPLRVSVNLR